MQFPSTALPTDTKKLHNIVLELQSALTQKNSEITQLKQQYQNMLEQFRLAQHKQFGKSSEVNPDQQSLFNEVEELTKDAAQETECVSYTRQKPKRKVLPSDLPREVIVHDIPEEDKHCDACGHELHKMGEDKTEQLEFIPAQVKVIEHVRLKYSCRCCEQKGIQVKIKTAVLPASPIPKSFATPSLISQIVTNKYQYALPLYRQESLFKQYGIELSRKTMSSWMIAITPLLKRITNELKITLRKQPVIHADETPLKVVHEDKNQCYMWVYCTGSDSPNKNATKDRQAPPNIVLYDYQKSRAGQCVRDYLQDFNGYLQVDGYAGYDQCSATLAGCWAHARRKFMEAKAVQVKGKTGKADWAINHIQKLYRIEKELQNSAPEEKRKLRQEKTAPLLNALKVWLDKSTLHVPPKSAIGKAIGYSLRQWQKLSRFTENGYLSIDNNRAERAIKPFVIGRKNWMFSNTSKGAETSAVLYSLIETAKANRLVPFDYIKMLLEQLPNQPESIEHLLPWNVSIPDK